MEENITGIIEKGCKIEGSLVFEGIFRIAGEFKGTIFTNDTLIITETGVVEGDINAGVIIVSGSLKGKVLSSGRVEMKNPARFEGSVLSPNLIVEEGVIFYGETRINENNLS